MLETGREFLAFLRGWRSVLRGDGFKLATLLVIGWLGTRVLLDLAVSCGPISRILSNLLFVASIGWTVFWLISVIHAVVPGMERRHTSTSMGEHLEPDRSLLSAALHGIAPFIAVWAAWGMIEDAVTELFMWHQLLNPVLGAGDKSDFWGISLSFNQIWLYLAFAGGAFLLRAAMRWLTAQRKAMWAGIPLLFAELLWSFSIFFLAILLLRKIAVESPQYAFWRNWMRLKGKAISLLPDWRLPFELTLPEAITGFLGWLASDLLPAIWEGVLFPLVLLSLVASILGWRRRSQVMLGTPQGRARFSRVRQKVQKTREDKTVLTSLVALLTADVREKYSPIATALGMMARAGLPFLGSFLVLGAFATWLPAWVGAQITYAFGPTTRGGAIATMPLRGLVTTLIYWLLMITLCVSAVERLLLKAERPVTTD